MDDIGLDHVATLADRVRQQRRTGDGIVDTVLLDQLLAVLPTWKLPPDQPAVRRRPAGEESSIGVVGFGPDRFEVVEP
jgi:hypothetical protein